MNRTHKNRLLLALAVGAAAPVLAWNPMAAAQVRNNQDGSALDANPRVGSGGKNEGATAVDNRPNAQRATGNQIVTGNVTGDKQFRDTVDYTDPSEFRDSTGVEDSSAFIRRSSGIGDARSGNAISYEARPFYDPGRTAQTPAGFEQGAPGVGEYVPKPPPENTTRNAAGFQNVLQPLSPIPRPGELVLPGPTDENGQQSLLTGSPLYGVRQWRPGQADDQQFLRDLSTSFTGRREVRMDGADFQRMREEISTPSEGEGQQQQPGQSNALDSKPVGSAVDTTGLSQPLDSSAVGAQPTGARQSTRTRILASPEQQSPQYAEMRRRLDKYNNDRNVSDQQAHQAFVEVQRARDNAKAQPGQLGQRGQPGQPGQPDGATAAGQPAPGTGAPGGAAPQQPAGEKPAEGTPPVAEQSTAEKLGLTDYAKRSEQALRGEKPAGAPIDPDAPTARPKGAPRPEPVKVPSLAEGTQGKGFSELLLKAEALMKEGKFTSALDEYDKAEAVAPNNPLVKLGRANAELGASYYSRADAHLREAFTADPALLIGQYDLRKFYGEDRLRTLVNDLKEIARVEERQARPVFLLAYIAYNSGNERMAGGYLDLAEKRAGGNDPIYKLIRDHWKLPDDAGPTDVEAPAAPQDLNK